MIVSQSHGPLGPADGVWLQVVLNEPANAATRGEVAIYDIAAGTITAGKVGIYVLRSAATANQMGVAGVFEDAFAAADYSFCGLVQRFGFHDGVDFGGVTAAIAGRRLSTLATAGKAASAGAAPSGTEAAASFGLCIQAGTGLRPCLVDVHG